MKTKKQLLTIALTTFIIFMLTAINSQSQIHFEGLYSQGEGNVGWNADGTGPEPAATGHLIPFTGFGNQLYYGASLDYITGNADDAGFHLQSGMTGFPEFEAALADNGYTADQVKVKFGLCSLGDDIEGTDWLIIDNMHYTNYYGISYIFELDGEIMLTGSMAYINYSINNSGGEWFAECAYSKPTDASGLSSVGVQNVAAAFLADLQGDEIRLTYNTNFAGNFSDNNGRNGAYYDFINGTIEKGLPNIPFKGMNADHEGFAGWDADGTGPEPYGNGHYSQLYYGASLDYDGIDPDPNACLGHFLQGSSGFINTMLQLQYRGFEIGDLKMKLGLNSLGPDVEGEDWGNNWCNYYNLVVTLEVTGESILTVMVDTSKLVDIGNYWISGSACGRVYDISENASTEAQFVAQSFLKDIGTHFITMNTSEIHYASLFNDNGRDGAKYNITGGALVGIHEQATFVPEGVVEGTWSMENSPYYVDGHLTVENGHTLTIEPGVRVAVRGPFHFTAQGCIKAQGTPDENIVFTRSNPIFYWDGFDYDNTPAANEGSIFDYCLFEYGLAQGETVEYNSGGMFAISHFDDLEIRNSTFRHNVANIPGSYSPSGGAIALESCDLTIEKCIFYDNYAEYGGAIFSYIDSHPVISNCLIYQNEAENGGAITFYDHGSGTLINNTIVDNSAFYGGGFFFYLQSNPEIINTILWGNEASTTGNQAYFTTTVSYPGFYYCDIEEGQAGFGGLNFTGDFLFNLDNDPIFETNTEFPYMISSASPCINTGTPDTSAWFYDQYLPANCLCGNPRILNDRIDIGAYERLITGLDNNSFSDKMDFRIFPNPCSDNINMEFELINPSFVTIELYDALGNRISIMENAAYPAGKHNIGQNIKTLTNGIYFCRLQAGNKIITRKINKL